VNPFSFSSTLFNLIKQSSPILHTGKNPESGKKGERNKKDGKEMKRKKPPPGLPPGRSKSTDYCRKNIPSMK